MARGLALTLLLCLTFLSACTQVLGLKRARLETDAGAAGTAATAGTGGAGAIGGRRLQSANGVPIPEAACRFPPGPSCGDCRRMKCQSWDVQCTSDPKCRVQLGKYAICLGYECNGDSESCSIKEISDEGVKYCLNACNPECGQTSLVSACELYCACMNGCPAEQQAELGTDCVGTCKTWKSEVTQCRRDHCETAQQQDDTKTGMALRVQHCEHANGTGPIDACPPYEVQDLGKRTICTDGNESNLSCKTGSDCCSGKCVTGVCK